MIRSTSLAILFSAVFSLVACQSGTAPSGSAGPAPAMAANTEPVPVLREIQGDDASLKLPAAVLVNAASETKVNLASLEVDFEKESVVIVSLGTQPTGHYGIKINSAQKKGTKLFVQGIALLPQNSAAAPQTPTNPFAAVVIPKFQGTVHPEIIDAK